MVHLPTTEDFALSAHAGPMSSAAATNGTALHLSAEEEALFTEDLDEEDDDMDDTELDALEASLTGANIQ